MSQILFLSGVTLTIGGRRTLNFFFKRKRNFKGTAFFFSGLALVSFLGDAKSLNDANILMGDAQTHRWLMLRACWVALRCCTAGRCSGWS